MLFIGMVLFLLGFASTASAQFVNRWFNRGGAYLGYTRGWLDWKKNDVDGRYCFFSGASHNEAQNDVWCFDANLNKWTKVYPGDNSATPPHGRDDHSWDWDHVGNEYYLFDGAFSFGVFAFNPVTKSWRQVTNAEYPGIGSRTWIFESGIATSPDHNLMVIAQGYPMTRVVRFLNLQNKTYEEKTSGSPPPRQSIQNQFLYISSIQKFLLFGGRGPSGYLNDLWLLDPVTKTWTPVAHVNPPPGNAHAHMAYDHVQNVVYLVGGDTGNTRVWVLHLSNWTWQQLPLPSGTALINYPSKRVHGTAMFDPAAGFCTVGGDLSGAAYWQTWQTWCFKHSLSTDTDPPDAPPSGNSNFVQSLMGNLMVAWQASPSDPTDVSRYEVQRSENGGTTWINQVNVTATGAASYAHTYNGVVDSSVRVRAVDSFGNPSEYVVIP
ncbi:MAG: Kelch repeat-containing protein [Candidatus Binatia bacterium]